MPALSVGFAERGSSRGSPHVAPLLCSSHALLLHPSPSPPPTFFFGRAAQRLCFEVRNGFSHQSAALGKGETHKELRTPRMGHPHPHPAIGRSPWDPFPTADVEFLPHTQGWEGSEPTGNRTTPNPIGEWDGSAHLGVGSSSYERCRLWHHAHPPSTAPPLSWPRCCPPHYLFMAHERCMAAALGLCRIALCSALGSASSQLLLALGDLGIGEGNGQMCPTVSEDRPHFHAKRGLFGKSTQAGAIHL